MAGPLGVVTNLRRRYARLGAPSTVDQTVGRGASFMAHNNAITPEPAPRRTDSPTVWPLIIRDLSALDAPDWLKQVLADDMRARDEFGRQKYGTPLQVENGRRAAVDAYQEALDLCAYTRQRAEQTRLGFWICAAQGAVNVAIAILHQMRLEAEGEG